MNAETEPLILSQLATLTRMVGDLHSLLLPGTQAGSGGSDGLVLGFVQHFTPLTRWVFVGDCEEGDSLWYFVVDGNRQPILEEALTGRIRRLFGVKRMVKGKLVHKLCLEIECGSQAFIVQSGLETCFSKGLVAGLEAAEAEAVGGIMTLKVRPGGSEKVVFCNLFAMPSRVPIQPQVHYETGTQTVEAAQRVCAKLGVPWEVRDFCGKTQASS